MTRMRTAPHLKIDRHDMPIITTPIQAHRFTQLADLDDVSLYIEHNANCCRFTITCYSNSWTAFFRDLDVHESPIDRLLNITPENMVRALQWGTPEILNRDRAKESIYLRHIVCSIKDELQAYMELQGGAMHAT